MIGKIASLTGIRGIAAIWVMLFHGDHLAQHYLGLPAVAATPVIRSGYLAVDLFFVLSGYILAATYANKQRAEGINYLRGFAIARICRIAPLNTFALFLFAALVAAFGARYFTIEVLDARSFLASLFLVQAWGFASATAWNKPAWSLSTEWLAYIFFPLLLGAATRTRAIYLAIGGLFACLALIALVMTVLGHGTLDHVWLLGLPRCLLQFTAGVFLWRCLSLRRVSTKQGNGLFVAGWSILAVVLVEPRAQLLAPLAFCLLVASCAVGSPFADSVFGNRPVTFLGEISFSIYLLHTLVLGVYAYAAERLSLGGVMGPGTWLFFGSFPLLVVAVSTLTWRYIELPGQKQGQRLRGAPQQSSYPSAIGALR